MKFEVRGAYGYDSDAASVAARHICTGTSRTQQSMKDEADINVIVKRFNATGMLPQSRLPPKYGDFTGVGTFQEAQIILRQATESFMRLPAAVRKRFDNDPAAFVDFATDPENLPELRKMGLVDPLPEPTIELEANSSPRGSKDGNESGKDVRAANKASAGGAGGERGDSGGDSVRSRGEGDGGAREERPGRSRGRD